VNSVAYKGCRVEVAGFRSNTAPKLIDVADCFIDLGEIAERVRKDFSHATRYEDRDIHVSQQPPPTQTFIEPVSAVPSPPTCSPEENHDFHPAIGSIIEANPTEGADQFGPGGDFIRVTDDQ